MAVTKGFLQDRPTLELPKYKYLVGVLVGLLMAFSLYALQYMTRELIRVSSISEDDIWILNDADVDFYNLIFAFIALIIGQSFCLEYWFNRPKNSLKARPGRLKNIIHEQRFMNWYFLSWFYRVATMYGFTFCTAGLADFYVISLFPDYYYMFVLVVIVLFLQTWNGLLLTFKRRAFKWMFFSLVMVSALSYGLSKVDIVDYKTLNETVIGNRLDEQYHLRLPKSVIYTDNGYRYRHLPNISVAMSKDSNNQQPLLFIGRTKIGLGELPREILKIRENQYAELQSYMPVFLRIDKKVPMSFVHNMKRELAFVNVQLLNYLTIPAEAPYDEKYYTSWNRKSLSRIGTDYFTPFYNEYLDRVQIVSNKIEISISNLGYEIDGNLILEKELATLLVKRMSQDLDYALILNFKQDVDFGVYFGAISKVDEAIYFLRDEMALKGYGMDFKSLLEENRYGVEGINESIKAIQSRYPMKYIENWSESGIQLPLKVRPDFALPELQ